MTSDRFGHTQDVRSPLTLGEIEVVISRKERAQYCTNYLNTFDDGFDWVEIAQIVAEVEKDELFLEVGDKTLGDWLRRAAPRSYRLCYMAKARYRVFKEVFTVEDMRKIPPQTAEWASKAKNISPEALKKSEVKQALMLPLQKAVAVLKEALPEQHIESPVRRLCKFAQSQDDAVQDAYAAFRRLKDENSSLEEFWEFTTSEWMDSVYAVKDGKSVTVRQCWEAMKRGDI